MDKEWVHDNLNVTFDGFEELIYWGNDIYTPVDTFLDFFGEVITQAIYDNRDVRKAIADNDNGRGYKDLILT